MEKVVVFLCSLIFLSCAGPRDSRNPIKSCRKAIESSKEINSYGKYRDTLQDTVLIRKTNSYIKKLQVKYREHSEECQVDKAEMLRSVGRPDENQHEINKTLYDVKYLFVTLMEQ